MISPISNPIHLAGVDVNGFATENVTAGGEAKILVRAAITSDQPEFYVYMKVISNILTHRATEAGIPILWGNISSFVLVAHPDFTAELYLQDFPLEMEILAKRDIAAGDVLYQSGVADVRRIRIPGLVLHPDDRVIVCLKVGWKFALFFDLEPERKLDVDEMETSLAFLYRQLSFDDAYKAFGDTSLFETIVHVGWFPFVELLGGDFENLLQAYNANFNIEGEEAALLKKFDAARVDAIAERWWRHPSLSSRKAILEPAMRAYKHGDAVSCIKIIVTEIEGVIRDSYIADRGKSAKIQDLLAYAADKALQKVGHETSLLFPKKFLLYLKEYTYAHFDPLQPGGDGASRHRVGHGAASADTYTLVRALQAVLTLDQLSFYL